MAGHEQGTYQEGARRGRPSKGKILRLLLERSFQASTGHLAHTSAIRLACAEMSEPSSVPNEMEYHFLASTKWYNHAG